VSHSPYQQHLAESASLCARCAVITISDTRTTATDVSGQSISALLQADSHHISNYHIIRDDPVAIESLLGTMLGREDVDLILTNGGTGFSRRDRTVDVVQRYLDQPLPGFGELFRLLSYQEIGSGAMLSRAIAGIARGKPVFVMPGSPAAAELAMTKLILPEIRHLLRELRK
jgi:molybdenum cofactor biosynthesis protein B